MYIILILLLLYIFFFTIFFPYNNYYINYYAKFIVVSSNDKGVLKIHTKPISLTEAIEIQKKLKKQYYYNRVFATSKEAFIIKFIKF